MISEAALEQIPTERIEQIELLLRVDSAGASHELVDWAREGRIRFSVGFELTAAVREAIGALPESAWQAALDQDDEPRANGEVAEATECLGLSGWPTGSRLIVRRERPHPGAQLSFSDADGDRFQAILSDQSRGEHLPPRASPPRPRQGRGPDPRRQGHRPGEAALSQL